MSAAPESSTCVVLGAGSWGTALAIQLARLSRPTVLWGRDPAHIAALASQRSNERYLPQAEFPDSLRIEPDLAAAVRSASDLLIAVPSHALRSLLQEIAPHLGAGARVSWATKGFELATGLLPHEVVHQVLGERVPTAVVSGPTFAKEVGAGLPTAMTVAASDATFASDLAQRLSGMNFRAYTSADMIGVETGGAIKNVLAIGAGISDGLGFGANTRIALITRGLVEMTRLGVALGARKETFMGLAGLGDLVLTCTGHLSRNRHVGVELAHGRTLPEILASTKMIAEGVRTTRAALELGAKHHIELPIAVQMAEVLAGRADVRAALDALMLRRQRAEAESA